jgi:hypothetical protein
MTLGAPSSTSTKMPIFHQHSIYKPIWQWSAVVGVDSCFSHGSSSCASLENPCPPLFLQSKSFSPVPRHLWLDLFQVQPKTLWFFNFWFLEKIFPIPWILHIIVQHGFILFSCVKWKYSYSSNLAQISPIFPPYLSWSSDLPYFSHPFSQIIPNMGVS